MKNYILLLILFCIFTYSAAQENHQNNIPKSNKQQYSPSNCPASPYAITITQPDQSQLTIVGKGNMNNHRTESIDGYTLLKNSNGIYEYANMINGQLRPSGVKARNPNQRSFSEISHVNSLQTSLQDPLKHLKSSVLNNARKKIKHKTYPTSGTINVLALLIDYPDLTKTFPKANFDSLLNGKNYRNGDGSFKAYYETASHGQLTINVDLMGWFRADSSYIWYGKDSGSTRAADLVREAVDSAEILGVNFAKYDNDSNGVVDGIMAIHAGQGAESGSQTQYIWSHRWVLNGGSKGAVTYDGVLINDYMINPEIRRRNQLNQIVGIGVFCHEFGHNLGLPDLYDTDDQNGKSEGIGNWGLMGGGGWLGREHQPGNFCAWSKIENGWESPQLLSIGTSNGDYTLNAASLNKNEIYRVNSPVPTEYFLLENRQKVGLDTALPGSGLAIWKINTRRTTSSRNDVNANHHRKGVELKEADGKLDLDNEVNRGDAGDLFPGTSNNTLFNDSSNPPAWVDSITPSGLIIRNISLNRGQINFGFGAPSPGICGTDTLRASSDTLSDRSGSNNYGNNLNCSWLIQPPNAQSITLSFTAFRTESGNDTLSIYDGSNSSAPILATYSGNAIPANVSSTSGSMYLTFKTNNSIVDSGWTASYTSTAGGGCSGQTTFSAANGNFTDGSGTANYKNNLNCSWLIQPSNNPALISFALDSINLANSGDYIRVYDGSSPGFFNRITTFSGNNTGNIAKAYSGSMLIVFNTDGSYRAKGWGGHYNSYSSYCVPRTVLTDSSGSIDDGSRFFSNYLNNTSCEWLIRLPNASKIIELNFQRLNTELNKDSLVIYDGATRAAPVLGVFSGNNLPPKILSSSNELLITFDTDSTNVARGWSATYQSQNQPYCNKQTILTAPADTFTDGSPSNKNYRKNSNCSWLIQPSGAVSVNLMFNRFNTEQGFDVVTVYDGTKETDPVLGTFSGSNLPQNIQANSGKMLLTFSTDPNTQFTGWEAHYTSSNTASVDIIQDTIYLNAGLGNSTYFDVNSNTQWSLNKSAGWLLSNPGSGSGNGRIQLIATQSNIGAPRSTIVYATSQNNQKTDSVIVIQKGSGNYLSSNIDTLRFSGNQSSKSFNIQANVSWSISGHQPPKVSLNKTSGKNNETISVTLGANNSGAVFYDTLIISSNAQYIQDDSIIIKQERIIKQLSVDPMGLYLLSNKGSKANFQVNSNQVWTAVSSSAWLKVNLPSITKDTNTVEVVAKTANNNNQSRVAYVAVENTQNQLYDTVWVIQLGSSIQLFAQPKAITLGQAANSKQLVSIQSSIKWTATTKANWINVSPAADSGNANLNIKANTANNSHSSRKSYVLLSADKYPLHDTIWVTQNEIPKQLSSQVQKIVLPQAANSTDSFMVNSNIYWQSLAANSWLTIVNPPITSDSNQIKVIANTANNSPSPRESAVFLSDTSATIFDTVEVIQMGTRPSLSLNKDTIWLAGYSGSSKSIFILANTVWQTTKSAQWYELQPSTGSKSKNISIKSIADNNSGSARFDKLIFNNLLNSAADTLIVAQDSLRFNRIDADPDSIILQQSKGSSAFININTPPGIQWNTSTAGSWFTANPPSGTASHIINVKSTSSNNSLNDRLSYLLVTERGNQANNDTVFITQKGEQPNLRASPSVINLNFTGGSHDSISVQSNLSWSVSNPVQWLSISNGNGNRDGHFIITSNSDNLSGNIRSASLTISAAGVPDQYVQVNQVDGSKASFSISRDTVFVAHKQGSSGNFYVLANSANWNLSENASWLTINPTFGTATQKITALAASKNLSGNFRYAKVTASDASFQDTSVIVAQRPSPPLFQLSPSIVTLGGDSASYSFFNLSSNIEKWTIDNDSTWIEVSPNHGAFSQKISITALEANEGGKKRTAVLTATAPPLVPQSIIVIQDTLWTTGIKTASLENNFKVYPNPSRGKVQLIVNDKINWSELKLRCYNNFGAAVHPSIQNIDQHQLSINFKDLASGIYFISIDYQGQRYSKKIAIIGN